VEGVLGLADGLLNVLTYGKYCWEGVLGLTDGLLHEAARYLHADLSRELGHRSAQVH
jgi:hypothetical protein